MIKFPIKFPIGPLMGCLARDLIQFFENIWKSIHGGVGGGGILKKRRIDHGGGIMEEE